MLVLTTERKMSIMKWLALIFTIANVDAGYFPTKCILSDIRCVTKAAQDYIPTFTAGIPGLGVETTEPLHIQHVDASNNVLSLVLTDIDSTGLKDTIVEKVSFDESKSTISLKLLITSNMDCQYEISGSLLFLPLKGSGNLHVKLRKMEVDMVFNYMEVIGKDGKPHWYFEYKSLQYTFKDRSDVVFENLFNGNYLLAKTAKEVISRSGNEIIQEVGYPVIKAVMDGVLTRINKLFRTIPVDEAKA